MVEPSGIIVPDIIADTRQQAGRHTNIDRWFDRHGVTYEYRKVDAGDYIRADGLSNRSIDTKKGIAEVAGNVGRDHDRLVREIERANDAGYRLIFLIEARGYHEIWDVARWVAVPCQRCQRRRMGYCDPRTSMRCATHKRKPMQGPQVARIMQGIARDHGCIWAFCDPASTGRMICEFLGVSYADRPTV